MLAMVLVFGLVLSGCSTTSSINYAVDTQPAGNYKHAVINVTSFHFSELFGSVSVLRRFYEQYPATQYEVVAYEKTTKSWIPATSAVVVGIVGGSVALATNNASTGQTYNTMDVVVTMAGFGAFGGLIGYMFSNNYVVTYVERQGVVPLTTQGPQG